MFECKKCRPVALWVSLWACTACDYPFTEGGVLVRVDISEGDAKFLYAMKLVPPEDLGFLEPKVLETLNASSL